ncbi:MAG TPA: DUF6569 family protein [Candidatus Nanoarchaeia archaeon]|nr:DUF6569 family protein [Candidatus Nanoarchaeia archaeon]
MKTLLEHVHGLEIGEVQRHKNMSIAPLFGAESALDYLVFDKALRNGLSISETGNVPTLHFANKTGKEVMILQGEYILGGKQNRMVAANVYMERGFDGDVPVRCVQQNRWQGDIGSGFDTSESIAPKAVMYAASVGQDEVWSEVRCLARAHRVATPTQNLGDIIQEKKRDTNDFVHSFSYIPGSIGIVASIVSHGITRYSADVFDRRETMGHHFNKLVESLALDALGGSYAREKNYDDFITFIRSIESCQFNERKPVSLGRDFQLQGQGIEGFALTYEEVPLYVTFSTSLSSHEPLNQIRTGYRRYR